MNVSDRGNIDFYVDRALSHWSSCKTPHLSVVLSWLTFLQMLHQTHHWQSKGDPFYGDHLLFQRLYEGVVDELDSVAERTVGIGDETCVAFDLRLKQVHDIMATFSTNSTMPDPNSLVTRSLLAEKAFIVVLEEMIDGMDQAGTLSSGTSNLLEGIADKHETNVYLLKQRLSK